MGDHNPKRQITPEGKVIKPKYKETHQLSSHIAKYQRKWIKEKKKDEKFNISGKIREMIDVMILEDENGLPEDLLMNEEDLEIEKDGVLDAFITSD